ncbi:MULTISPECIES: TetR family transcriptional regulator [unclassified Streptomyces]|uniref:TetR family transcriptional regulator n=1 Tax=unclassified Streptomyces TaxID=2593676 RepID=UPI001BED0E31|nr:MULTISPECIES: TetR family transcriptional regulator [unclassified Streptomyces]MBT2407937.1 TetR family transcriptional regulator [Streptomyces sp. ISL-21]MBT2608613.1 TetR family transcriptional regulator [Streptomyces sp. ISL-87]
MATETRGRMLEAAVQALQWRGVAGMSFTELLRDSGAARGAIYHHFPGGKAQLVAEAATRNGQDIRAHLAALPAGSPHAVVEAFLTFVRPVIEAATTGSGCAVAAVTVDPESDTLREVAATAFGSIDPATATGAAAEQLEATQRTLGVTPNMARAMANSPAALKGFLGLFGALKEGVLSAGIQERIALAVAEFNGCSYCHHVHAVSGTAVADNDSVLVADLLTQLQVGVAVLLRDLAQALHTLLSQPVEPPRQLREASVDRRDQHGSAVGMRQLPHCGMRGGQAGEDELLRHVPPPGVEDVGEDQDL